MRTFRRVMKEGMLHERVIDGMMLEFQGFCRICRFFNYGTPIFLKLAFSFSMREVASKSVWPPQDSSPNHHTNQ